MLLYRQTSDVLSLPQGSNLIRIELSYVLCNLMIVMSFFISYQLVCRTPALWCLYRLIVLFVNLADLKLMHTNAILDCYDTNESTHSMASVACYCFIHPLLPRLSSPRLACVQCSSEITVKFAFVICFT